MDSLEVQYPDLARASILKALCDTYRARPRSSYGLHRYCLLLNSIRAVFRNDSVDEVM